MPRSQEAGKAYWYTVNREHLATPGLEQVISIRSELERRLRAEVGAWKVPAAHISMFGSAARGDGDEHGDIDVFVVRRAGVPADDRGWRAQQPPVADELRHDAITIFGPTPRIS